MARLTWPADGAPVYTSDRDRKPGDVLGGTKAVIVGEQGRVRFSVGPPPRCAAGAGNRAGSYRPHGDHEQGYSVYSSDADAPNNQLQRRVPAAVDPGRGSPRSRNLTANGASSSASLRRQWAFRGKPLHTYALEKQTRA